MGRAGVSEVLQISKQRPKPLNDGLLLTMADLARSQPLRVEVRVKQAQHLGGTWGRFPRN